MDGRSVRARTLSRPCTRNKTKAISIGPAEGSTAGPRCMAMSRPCLLCHARLLARRDLLAAGAPVLYASPTRGVAIVARVIRGVFRLRYLVLGSAVGGGVQLTRKFDEWKQGLPDFKWLSDVFPEHESLDRMSRGLQDLADRLRTEKNVFSDVSNRISGSVEVFSQWLDEAREARRREQEGAAAPPATLFEPVLVRESAASNSSGSSYLKSFLGSGAGNTDSSSEDKVGERERLQQVQQELMRVQRKYQKELDKLEQDNKVLRQQLLLKSMERKSKRKVKKSLIEMYSEVLDELNDYDSTFHTQDNLPRVIVVGDQSAGKTSALEMIAQARIFPRGAGEMMTRAPVKVTLCEGPYHVAHFKDSTRIYDLTKESELVELREEIEKKMRLSVRLGKTISSEVISLTVQGPGIQRMVLVDLPGVISTVTTEMSRDTRDSIKELAKAYMSNPNAIILCIQDGSVDAERSIVTDLVSEMDPQGKRTIFVLTKVDIAEKNMANPGRIRKILDGKLFPMKALGYFAVVTGRGGKNDSIEEIKEYEDEFFRTSRLCKDGILTASQCTTRNLGLAVSECFWKMVKSSVEEQAEAFKKTRFNLETEWKNQFPHQRELSRDELFEKARGEILDEIVKLMNFSPRQWESVIQEKLWQKLHFHVFERVYLPAAQTSTSGTFNTQIDINLKHWAEGTLSKKAIEAGLEALLQEFSQLIERSKTAKGSDPVFNDLKAAVSEEARKKHVWQEKASEILKVIQMNALEDRSIGDQIQWNSAVNFMESAILERLNETEKQLHDLVGPSMAERWMYWRWKTDEQYKRDYIKHELDKLLRSNTYQGHLPALSSDEITVVKKNLQTQGILVDPDSIKQVWFLLFRSHFLNNALERARSCRGGYQLFAQCKDSEMNCNDVVLFWRIQRMMSTTANALRQQIMNVESRRLENEIKEILDDMSQDEEEKESLLTGRRVQLAEELRKVRQIEEKLELFMRALSSEK